MCLEANVQRLRTLDMAPLRLDAFGAALSRPHALDPLWGSSPQESYILEFGIVLP